MCVFVPVCLCVHICIFVVSFLVCKLHSFYYSPEAESAAWKATLLSGLLEYCSDGGVFPSDVEGMHESMDGFPVKSIWIYLYLRCCQCVSLDRGQNLAILDNSSLWMSRTVLSESPVASAYASRLPSVDGQLACLLLKEGADIIHNLSGL